MRRPKMLAAALAVPILGGAVVIAPSASAATEVTGKTTEFTVLAADAASVDEAEQAVADNGGKVVEVNKAIGLLTVKAPENGFAKAVTAEGAVFSAAQSRAIGHAPERAKKSNKTDSSDIEKEHRTSGKKAAGKAKAKKAAKGLDPLDEQLWGLKMTRSDLARDVTKGSKQVKVGVIDTGVDGSHPDIKPNFDSKLSRNFTTDIPTDENGEEVDGPCEFRGCVDPADHDDNGHGTHVAGTIGAAANKLGVSGIAPKVSLVNLRAGHDSGYFFLDSVTDALTYAGDKGIDVVNMSFYVDPWAFNCKANPEDSAAEQLQQRTTIEAVSRAMNYAHERGVTQVTALGNNYEDLGAPRNDVSSPNYPAGNEKERPIDNDTCFDLPTEGPNAISVSALGPSKKKSDFSNYGPEQVTVSAPGGYARDYFGTPDFNSVDNLILSTYPKNVALAEGAIDEDGNITEQGKEWGVQKDTDDLGETGYYQPLQGTSMASPHAAGVASLIVSQYGKKAGSGFGLDPLQVRRVIKGTAQKTPCPTPRTVDYLDEGRTEEWTATCVGGPNFNGFYGYGVVDSYNAVTKGDKFLKN